MNIRRTRIPAVVALASALLAATAVTATSGASAAPDTDPGSAAAPLRYVALGDSYSAGAGLQPLAPEAPPSCQQAQTNYPKVIAEATGADLTDVTCSGARTRDYRKSQDEGVAPQLEALSRRTQLVTQTIGGNDGGVFGDAIQTCSIAGGGTSGQGSPCKDQNGSRFVDKIREDTYPNLVAALRRVHKAAPRAEVAILGYPWVLPKTEGCFPSMPVATGDVPYLRNMQRVLNDAVRRAAEQTGSTYVDFTKASEGHDACQAPGVRWIEPVFGGTNPVVVHPNAFGEEQMALRTLKVLGLS